MKIAFLEHNPYMSVELLDLLSNYKIICYNNDATYQLLKKDWDIESYLNTEFIEEPESDRVAEILLSDEKFLERAIPNKEDSGLLFFFMNRRMDELREKADIPMLLPSFDIQERLGNKIFLSRICEKLSLHQNKSLEFQKIPSIPKLFEQCQTQLGIPFIVQDALGESGWDTSLVKTEIDLREAGKKIKNGMRASRYLSNNIPISVHICILNDQIITRGPWLQLVGFSELSVSPFRFTGNDTNQSLLSQQCINEVLAMTNKIAIFLRDEGYRGILGIDYLWDKNTEVIYPQEINSRFVGLTRLLTGIQKDQLLFPDLLRHIEAFTTPSYTIKAQELNVGDIDLSNRDYSQVIVRHNGSNATKVIRRLEPGIYRLRENILHKTQSSLFVQDMREDEILITSAAHAGCVLYPDEAIVRLILKKSVVQKYTYTLTPEVLKLIDVIKNYTFKV